MSENRDDLETRLARMQATMAEWEQQRIQFRHEIAALWEQHCESFNKLLAAQVLLRAQMDRVDEAMKRLDERRLPGDQGL